MVTMNARVRTYNKNSKIGTPWLWVPTLYFVEGVPYFIVTSVSVAMFSQLGMPNAQMALFTSLITFPWIIKPLWSPFVDVIRTTRWWFLLMQGLMALSVALLALLAPFGHFTIGLILFTITAFCSATHDIAADGYYMQVLDDKRQAAFVGVRSVFYKIANIFCQSVLLVLVGVLERHVGVSVAWEYGLLVCSGLLTLFALWHAWVTPPVTSNSTPTEMQQIGHDVWQTFVTFFRKQGIGIALLFMLFYRLPEALLLKLCIPFFLASKAEGGLALDMDTIGSVYGGFGVAMMLVGGVIGGVIISRWGLRRCIMGMCLCLTLPCAVYCYLSAAQPQSLWLIGTCIGIEQLGYGLGYTACMMYMIHVADGAHKTAHFSICTALMFLGLMLPGLVAGYIEEATGYIGFFYIVMLCCVPSIIVSWIVKRTLPHEK